MTISTCSAEQEVWAAQHYDPKIFKTDPGGIVYQRYWHQFNFFPEHEYEHEDEEVEKY